MTLSLHPHNLQAFVNGRLSAAEAAAVLDHLARCDHCLDTVDQLWTAHPLSQTDWRTVPEPDRLAVKRLEDRLMARIHRSDLSGRVAWLGTVGFMNMCLTLFQPMLETYLTLLILIPTLRVNVDAGKIITKPGSGTLPKSGSQAKIHRTIDPNGVKDA